MSAFGAEITSLFGRSDSCHVASCFYDFTVFVTSGTSDMDDWNPGLCGGEDALVESIEAYTRTNRQIAKELLLVFPADIFLCGYHACMLAFFFGRVPALVEWSQGAAAEFKELDLPQMRDYISKVHEVMNARQSAKALVRIGRPAEAYDVLEALGFVWGEDGFAFYDLWFVAASQAMPGWAKDADEVWHRLLVYSALPQSDLLDAEVSAWIPTAAAIAEHERAYPWSMHFGCTGLLCLAAAAFLRLGRDGDAAEAARILVSPEHRCIQKADLAHGHGARRAWAGGREARRLEGGRLALRKGARSRIGQPLPAAGGAGGTGLEAGCAWERRRSGRGDRCGVLREDGQVAGGAGAGGSAVVAEDQFLCL